MREIARRPDELKHLLGSAKGLMWLLFCISVPLLGVAILVQNIPSVVKAQCFLMGVASLTSLQGVSYADYLLGRTQRTPDMAHLMIYTKTEANEFNPWTF